MRQSSFMKRANSTQRRTRKEGSRGADMPAMSSLSQERREVGHKGNEKEALCANAGMARGRCPWEHMGHEPESVRTKPNHGEAK